MRTSGWGVFLSGLHREGHEGHEGRAKDARDVRIMLVFSLYLVYLDDTKAENYQNVVI